MSNDKFVEMIAILSAKLVNQADVIDQYILQIEGLERRIEELQDQNVNELSAENNRLITENNQLYTKLYGTAETYMQREGLSECAKGNKIPVMGIVRQITGLSLKESKDFVDNYIREHDRQ